MERKSACESNSLVLINGLLFFYFSRLLSRKSKFIFLPFTLKWLATLVALAIDFSLVFLHNFMFKVIHNTLINLISIISFNFTQES